MPARPNPPDPAIPILIIGKKAPPVGGVTVHVTRLIEGLSARNFPFAYADLQRDAFIDIIRKLWRHKIIHLHTSNAWLQLISALICKTLGKILLITYHGNWGRFGEIKNLAVRISAECCSCPIVQNAESHQLALRKNRNARCIRAYIRGAPAPPPSPTITSAIQSFNARYSRTYCTHAWNLVQDKHGQELYGIVSLANHIRHFPTVGLIIADPSGQYQERFKNDFGKIPGNVLIISRLLDFRSILLHCDGYIRNTTTDGASVTIEEALDMKKIVLASDAVSRVAGCHVFHRIEDVDLGAELGRNVLPESLNTPGGDEVLATLMAVYQEYLK